MPKISWHPVGGTRRRVGILVIITIAQPDNARVWKQCDWLRLVCVGEWENHKCWLGPSVVSATTHHAYKLECEDHRCWSRPLFVSSWVLLIARVWQMLAYAFVFSTIILDVDINGCKIITDAGIAHPWVEGSNVKPRREFVCLACRGTNWETREVGPEFSRCQTYKSRPYFHLNG